MSTETAHSRPISAVLPAVGFVAVIFFCNFITRVVFAPLMPVIQTDLGFTHAGAGYLFLALGTGNALGLLFSGFASRVLNHRKTVGVSAIMVGLMALAATQSMNYATLMTAMLAIGISVGLYLPSGIASITYLVRKKDWGKALAAHEMAPNLSYVIAPLLAEGVLLWFDWHAAFYLLGVAQIVFGGWFLVAGKGSEEPGMVPHPDMVMQIVRQPVFWLLVLMFCMAVGASIGPYSMIPLYLVDTHGYTREQANHLLAMSRIMACFVPFIAGWLTDKWGARPVILLYLIFNGCALLALGLTSGSALVAMVLLQPVFSVILFAPGFTMFSLIFDPMQRSVALALMGPINAVIGLGVVPTFLGHMGDAGAFHVGFMIQGCLLIAAIAGALALPKERA